ncbi:PilZ domain-containing protein [Dokdonella sp.]|uniref:PilZ domain-containing protein n=1 Tax=Dokdonella sp. TaxID=2291710 RepID=UPI0035273932
MSDDSAEQYSRHARMPIRSIVLISMGPLSWVTEVENISATGLLAQRPSEWNANAGERCVLDLLVGDDLHIHLEANVSRLTPNHVAFAYTNIPEDKEHALWGLLGQYADHVDKPVQADEQD